MQYPIKLKLSNGETKEFWLSDEPLQFGSMPSSMWNSINLIAEEAVNQLATTIPDNAQEAMIYAELYISTEREGSKSLCLTRSLSDNQNGNRYITNWITSSIRYVTVSAQLIKISGEWRCTFGEVGTSNDLPGLNGITHAYSNNDGSSRPRTSNDIRIYIDGIPLDAGSKLNVLWR